MMRKVVDQKGRPVKFVYAYTGIVPNGMSKEEFRMQHGTKFPRNGYYMSITNLFYNVPVGNEEVMTFQPGAATTINSKYRGMQFLEKGGKIAWVYFIDINKLKKFTYILGGKMDSEIALKIAELHGYDREIYRYMYDTKGTTMENILLYNHMRNTIMKLETDGFMKVFIKAYSPIGIMYPTTILSKTPSYLDKGWINQKINIRKMVKPSFIRYNKNQLDYVERQVVEIVKHL